VIRAVDLFAGAGGCSTGLLQAATRRRESVDLVAVNHWPIAVETHTRNHPEARHFCAPVETLDPRVAVPGGKLDILIAAPECTHHSTARGGKPINDQSRASAWHILRWLELLSVEHVLIENVPEFQTWGPIGKTGRPLKHQKGETFRAFIAALESYGYRVECKVLNAADYGAATTRRRLFIVARRGKVAPSWPAPTHSKTGAPTLFGGSRKWRAAREIIDWSLPSQSIFTRARPLKPATMRRILEGLRRFGGAELEPFLVILRQHMAGRSLDGPLPALTAEGTHVGLAQPVIVKVTHGDRKRERSVDEPLPTITAANRGELGVAEPFLIPYHAERAGQSPRTHDVNAPLPVVPTSPVFGLVEPFIVTPGGPNLRGGRSVADPLATVCGGDRFAIVEPFVLQQQSGGVARTVEEPAPTIAAKGAVALVEPFIVPPRHMGDGAVDSVDQPVRTVTAAAGHVFGLAEPFLTKYTSTGQAYSVEQPIDTITTRDRFGLVQPVVNGYVLDIKFRMLQPHELAAAMSFPKGYVFTGNKGDAIKQIGNAVDCAMAEALTGAILDTRNQGATTPIRKRATA
jgi:DNA (cytosine-5)-methyltransferase 1